MTIRFPRKISRRRFLSSVAATGVGFIAMPHLRAPPTARSLPMACNPATSAPMAASRAPTGPRR